MPSDRPEIHWLHECHTVSFTELVELSGLSEAEVRELVEYEVLQPSGTEAPNWSFGAQCLSVARTARRLRSDFDLTPPGLALVLTLLERVRHLEEDLRRAQVRLPRHRTL